MEYSAVQELLLEVARDLNLDLSGVKLKLKPYAKTRYGSYSSKTKTITVYMLTDAGKLRSVNNIIGTFIHEFVHYEQWTAPGFKRYYGVSHDPAFIARFNVLWLKYYSNRRKYGKDISV